MGGGGPVAVLTAASFAEKKVFVSNQEITLYSRVVPTLKNPVFVVE